MTTTDPKLIEPVAFMLSYPCGDVRMRRLFFPEAPPCASSRIEGDKIEPLYTAAAINEAAQKERAGVVAWLRGQAAIFNDQNPNLSALPEWTLAQKWANAIERSEHLPSPPAIEAKESQHG